MSRLRRGSGRRGAGRRGSGDDGSLFEQAMREVERLPRDRERVPGRRRRQGARPPSARRPPSGLEVEQHGEHHEGLAPGAGRRLLRRLRDGAWPIDARLNLRRMREAAAHEAVAEAVGRAVLQGQRCLLIVHGRGHRSAAGPVLKTALPGWLSEPPHGPRVLAFTTAPPELGGAGATLVLLRKKR